MIQPPSASRLRAERSFYRPHLLAFLDFYYSQRFARGASTSCYEKQQSPGTAHHPRWPNSPGACEVYSHLDVSMNPYCTWPPDEL